MSKKKTKLEIGKFYYIYGGGAHPSYIFEITNYGTFKAIKFGTTKGKHMTEIKPIQNGYKCSYVYNRPFEGIRSDFGERELIGLEINSDDFSIVEQIKKRPSRMTRNANKKCRQTY